MSLPSKWAPEGLSLHEQRRTITTGRHREKPVDYVLRNIENRVDDRANNPSGVDEDIEMVEMDGYEEVDAISSFIDYSRNHSTSKNDVLEAEFDSSPEFVITTGHISFLVVDTNFIISHLLVLDNLKAISENFGLRIIIPITVVAELDGLKSSTRVPSESALSGKTVGQLARWANDWIYSALANNAKVIKGQKLHQKLDRSARQDDAILDCCLYLQRTNTNVLVVLLSNDKNLCMKALSNDVKTVSYTKGMTAELIAKTIYNENVNLFGKSNQIQTVEHAMEPPKKNIQQPSKQWVEAVNTVDETQTPSQICKTVFREVQAITTSAIHHAMRSEYEDDLDIVRDYDHDSVQTLHDGAEVLIRFWFTVFQDFFKGSNFTPFHSSGRNSAKYPLHDSVPEDLDELQNFVRFWGYTLCQIYDAVMDDTQINALQILINRWCKFAGIES